MNRRSGTSGTGSVSWISSPGSSSIARRLAQVEPQVGAVEDPAVFVVEPADEESEANGPVSHVGVGHRSDSVVILKYRRTIATAARRVSHMSPAPPAASSPINVLAVIPARKGSKRLPGKNWRPLGGKPLILWTIEAATRSSRITKILVSTDAPLIADLARSAGIDVPFLRPSTLATDSAKTVDVVRHSVDFVETKGTRVSSVVTLQPTSPLRSTADIDASINLHLQDPTRSVVSVAPVHPSPGLWMFIEKENLLPVSGSWPKAGDRPAREVYALNGAIFVTPRKILEAGDLVGPDPRAYIMPRERSIDIDDELDWRIAEALIR